jgi:hypothetical protein
MDQDRRGWLWAYRKLRGWHVSAVQATYRASRYILTGDTGSFPSHGGWRKSRLTRG